MSTWTNEQHRAIYHKDNNITVSASAGSGKTTILVERILTRVLQDRIPLDRIVAMTFTEAAASEMKKRLFAALNRSLVMAKDHEKPYIEEQLVLLQRAQLSTIHSFCLSIIQENYAMIGFSLTRLQSIISEDYAKILKQEAMKDTIKDYLHDSRFPSLKQYFSPRPHDHSIMEEQLMRMARELASIVDMEQFLSAQEATYHAKNFASLPGPLRTSFYAYLLDYVGYLEETLDHMVIHYQGEKESNIAPKQALIAQMKRDLEDEQYAMFRLHFEALAVIPTATYKNSPLYGNLRAQLHELEDTLASLLFEEHLFFDDLHAMYPMMQLFLEMATSYQKNYNRIKEVEEVMDFDDMEAKAIELLTINNYEIAQRYQTRFIDILVDEYQDSSYHQDALIRLIQNKNNVFRVGDVKQSIYRFRGAVPSLLKQYIQAPSELDEVIHLRHNYRSNSQIITYVNQLFELLMRLPSFPVLFEEEDVAHVGLESQYTTLPSISLHILQSDLLLRSENEDEDQETMASEDLRAMYIANLLIQDKEKTGNQWSDYVILVRNHSRKKSLKRAFELANIPNFIDSKEGFYHATIVETMRAFFKVIENPHDNLNFVALCLSCIYELTDNDIASLKLQTNASFYECACSSNNSMLQLLVKDIQQLSKHVLLSTMMQAMFLINNFYETKTVSEDRTNLDLLYDKAVQFEKKGQGTLSHFIAFTDSLVESKSSEALSINIEEDVVRVMTIHQSKGLQFHSVIYWGKEKGSSLHAPLFYLDQKLGLGMDYLKLPMRLNRPTLVKLVLEHQDRIAEISEEIRILYVALTRAKKQLFMITAEKTAKIDSLLHFPLTKYQLLQQMNFSHWLANLSAGFDQNLVSIALIDRPFQPLVVEKKAVQLQSIQRWFSTPQQVAAITPSADKQQHLFDWIPTRNQASIGTLTHHLIQKMDVLIHYKEEDLRKLVGELDSSYVLTFDYSKILALQESPLYQSCKEMEVYKELPFSYLNSSYQLVSGYMDFVAIGESEVIIVDYKSDQHTNSKRLVAEYGSQLRYYIEALRIQYPTKQIRAYLYSLWLSEFIVIEA